MEKRGQRPCVFIGGVNWPCWWIDQGQKRQDLRLALAFQAPDVQLYISSLSCPHLAVPGGEAPLWALGWLLGKLGGVC